MTGIKHDEGKLRLADFITDFKDVFQELALIYEFGTNKYGRKNWSKVENGYERYSNALMRHFLSEGTDAETGIDHQAHVAYNALMRLHFILEEKG